MDDEKEIVMTTDLTRRELYNIRLHKMLAAAFYCSEKCWKVIRGLLFLFSRKTKAQKLARTGEIFEAQGETETAVKYFEQALATYSRLHEIRLNLCRCYLRLLSLKKARDHGFTYLKKKPDDPEANLYAGVILYYENEYQKALEHLTKAEDLLPKREKKRASALEYMGECYIKLERNEEAAKCFEESVSLNPYSGGGKKFVSLGECYCFLDRKEDALNAFKKSLEIAPNNHEAWNNIGVLLWTVGNIEDAFKCFRKSLDIAPDYLEAKTNIQKVEQQLRLSGTHEKSSKR